MQTRDQRGSRHNWVMRLASLLLATLMFMFVRTQENVVTESFRLPISMKLPVGQKRIEPRADATVKVTIEGPAEIVDRLEVTDLKVEPDISGIQPGRPALAPLKVTVDRPPRELKRLDIRLARPTIRVHLESEAQRTMPVATEFIGGVPSGWAVEGLPAAKPPQVQIIGPQNAVDKVARLVASFQLQGQPVNEGVASVRALDKRGAEVPSVALNPPQVQVKVTLGRRVVRRLVYVQPVWRGLPPDVRIQSVTVEPRQVVIRGSADALQDLDFISTPPITITTAPGSFTATVKLTRPENTVSMTPDNVVVTIVTEKIAPELPSAPPMPKPEE